MTLKNIFSVFHSNMISAVSDAMYGEIARALQKKDREDILYVINEKGVSGFLNTTSYFRFAFLSNNNVEGANGYWKIKEVLQCPTQLKPFAENWNKIKFEEEESVLLSKFLFTNKNIVTTEVVVEPLNEEEEKNFKRMLDFISDCFTTQCNNLDLVFPALGSYMSVFYLTNRYFYKMIQSECEHVKKANLRDVYLAVYKTENGFSVDDYPVTHRVNETQEDVFYTAKVKKTEENEENKEENKSEQNDQETLNNRKDVVCHVFEPENKENFVGLVSFGYANNIIMRYLLDSNLLFLNNERYTDLSIKKFGIFLNKSIEGNESQDSAVYALLIEETIRRGKPITQDLLLIIEAPFINPFTNLSEGGKAIA